MKNISSFLYSIILTIACVTIASTQNESIYNLKSNFVKIEANYLDVKILTWNENYIKIDSEIKINDSDGRDKHELQVQNADNGIVIKSIVNTEDIEEMVISIDKDGKRLYTPASNWDESKKGDKKYPSYNVGYEINGSVTIFVPESMLVKIQTTYGNVNMDGAYQQIETCSTYGMIEAKLRDVSKMKKVYLKSTYKMVDLTLEQNSNATLNLNTSYGNVFSDLPLESKSLIASSNSCSKFSEKFVLNDGSVAIDIIATYDNIYVRSNQ